MALLADTQYGFPGTVTPTAFASIMGNAASGSFGVGGLNDLKLTTNAVGDRGALLSTGLAYGHGCLGIWTSTTQFNFTAASGTSDRWDCIVVRRTWSNTPGVSVTTLAVKTGTSSKALPSLVMTPGTQTEQPLWLVRVKGGQTAIQEIVDLRCFSGNGGVQAIDSLALGYLNQVGSRVEVAGDLWEYKAASTTSSAAWQKISGEGKIPMWGHGGALSGSASGWDLMKIQAGSEIKTTDASGYVTLTFPTPFPNGLLFVAGFDGDDWAGGGSMMIGSAGRVPVYGTAGAGNKTQWKYAVKIQPASRDGVGSMRIARAGNFTHRINWIAIGF